MRPKAAWLTSKIDQIHPKATWLTSRIGQNRGSGFWFNVRQKRILTNQADFRSVRMMTNFDFYQCSLLPKVALSSPRTSWHWYLTVLWHRFEHSVNCRRAVSYVFPPTQLWNWPAEGAWLLNCRVKNFFGNFRPILMPMMPNFWQLRSHLPSPKDQNQLSQSCSLAALAATAIRILMLLSMRLAVFRHFILPKAPDRDY